MTYEYDIEFVQGDTFDEMWAYGSSVSGKTARMKIKKTPSSISELDLTETAGITLGGNSVRVTITAAQSEEIPAGQYIYDLKLITGSSIETFRRGYVNVLPQASDDA